MGYYDTDTLGFEISTVAKAVAVVERLEALLGEVEKPQNLLGVSFEIERYPPEMYRGVAGAWVRIRLYYREPGIDDYMVHRWVALAINRAINELEVV